MGFLCFVGWGRGFFVCLFVFLGGVFRGRGGGAGLVHTKLGARVQVVRSNSKEIWYTRLYCRVLL